MAIHQLNYCTHCGAPLSGGPGGHARFCRSCGHALASGGLTLVPDLPVSPGLRRRAAAALVDVVLAGSCALVGAALVAEFALFGSGRHTASAGTAAWLAAGLVLVAYQPFFWALSGHTPGMQLLGLRLRRLDGSRVGLGRATLRMFAMILSALPLGLGFAAARREPRSRSWHDRLAGTVIESATP